MHVLTVPQSLVFLRGQIGFMKARGFDITVICSPGADLDDFGLSEQVRVIGVEMPRRVTPVADLASVARLVGILRHIRPHIVHSHTPKGGLLGMLAATVARVPARVYHMRGLPMETAKGARRALLAGTERVSTALASEVLCVSSSLRQSAVAAGIVRPERIQVLLSGSGNGVDASGRFNPELVGREARNETRASLGIPQDATVVGFVGRLVRDKGLVELSRAWRSLNAARPGARLLVVGEHEPRDPVPEEVRRMLDEDPTIRTVGFQRNIERFYAAMDVLVLPTYREGFPNVLLEAGAMGLPVVATRASGCVDAVVDESTGLLVPVGDAAALARALGRYLDDPGLRERHGRAGRRRVEDSFVQERLWDALAATYERLIERTDGERPARGTSR